MTMTETLLPQRRFEMMATKTKTMLMAAMSVSLIGTAASAATLSINEASAPTTDVILQNTVSGSLTRSFYNSATAGTTTRGQTFLAPDTGDANTGYSVTGITLKKSATQGFDAGDNLHFWVFAYSPSNDGNVTTNWEAGDGWDPDTTDLDPLNGTGSTLLDSATISLSGLSLTTDTYFTFDFSASPLTLAENTAYGFLLGYTDEDDAQYFEYRVDNNGAGQYGGGIQIRTGDNGNTTFAAAQDLTFYITGTAVPEPGSLALLGLGGLLIARRRRA